MTKCHASRRAHRHGELPKPPTPASPGARCDRQAIVPSARVPAWKDLAHSCSYLLLLVPQLNDEFGTPFPTSAGKPIYHQGARGIAIRLQSVLDLRIRDVKPRRTTSSGLSLIQSRI